MIKLLIEDIIQFFPVKLDQKDIKDLPPGSEIRQFYGNEHPVCMETGNKPDKPTSTA